MRKLEFVGATIGAISVVFGSLLIIWAVSLISPLWAKAVALAAMGFGMIYVGKIVLTL